MIVSGLAVHLNMTFSSFLLLFFHSYYSMSSISVTDASPPIVMSEIEYVAHVVVLPFVLAVGFINQCVNMATLLHLPPRGFVYLKASALADICSIIAFVPFVLHIAGRTIAQSKFVMFYHAHMELPVINGFLAWSGLCIVAMTVDRYLSVCHPIRFFNNSDSRRVYWVVAALFVVSFAIQIPAGFQKLVVGKNDTDILTYEVERNFLLDHNNWFQFYKLIREVITKWGPIFLIVVLNILMVDALCKLQRRGAVWRPASTRDRPPSERIRLSVLLLVTSVTFVICHLPASMLHLFVHKSTPSSHFWQSFRAAANISETSAYLFNFYLYALCSSEYRDALGRLFTCKVIRKTTLSSPTRKVSALTRQNETSMMHPMVPNNTIEPTKNTSQDPSQYQFSAVIDS